MYIAYSMTLTAIQENTKKGTKKRKTNVQLGKSILKEATHGAVKANEE